MLPRDVFGQRQRAERGSNARILSHASRIFIIREKLTQSEILRISDLARALGAIVCEAREDANILVTELRAPKRIEKHTSEKERVSFVAYDRGSSPS